jgi:sulfide dehydrogenase cytochrome subunit
LTDNSNGNKFPNKKNTYKLLINDKRVVDAMKNLSRRLFPASLLLSFSLSTMSGITLADDPAVNRLLASQCAQCHGTNGYSDNEIEGIAGEEAKDMYEDLIDMKGEDKPEGIMDHQALGYSDDQIRRIAQYYASLPEEQRSEGREGAESLESSPEADSESGDEDSEEREDEDDEDEDEDEDEEDEEDEEDD